MRIDYSNKLALITGGSSGIGLEMAKQLVAQGARVCILARDLNKLNAACEIIRAASPSGCIECLQADVTDPDQVRAAVSALEQREGSPDLLFNCASIADAGRFVDHDPAIFHEMMEVNYFGTLNVILAVWPGMARRGSGHIVNFSSVAGFLGTYGYSAYGPTKFAIRGLTDTLRYELCEQGIRLSVVFPTDTQTPQLDYENLHKPPVLREIDKTMKVLPASVVANTVLKAVARGRYVITTSVEGNLFYQLSNFFGLVYPVMVAVVGAARRAVRSQGGGTEYDCREQNKADPDQVGRQ